MVKTSGRFTNPWISSRCWSGSMSGVPEWLRSKCSPFGVIMPLRSCSGVRGLPTLTADDQGLPLLHLALHDWVIAWDRRTGGAWLGGRALDGDRERLRRRGRDAGPGGGRTGRARQQRILEKDAAIENAVAGGVLGLFVFFVLAHLCPPFLAC